MLAYEDLEDIYFTRNGKEAPKTLSNDTFWTTLNISQRRHEL